MNDKEKLISFINKGKENKPVKEVHVIKDSPTEAHILLVNEDGTNVASNRFEIMDAHDLMTLIENPGTSGLIIGISEDNKKVRITNDDYNTFGTLYFDELDIVDDARWQNFANFMNMLRYLDENNGDFYFRKANEFEFNSNPNGEYANGHDFLNYGISYTKFEGVNDDNLLIIGMTSDINTGTIKIIYSDGSATTYQNVIREYQVYSQVNGELHISISY